MNLRGTGAVVTRVSTHRITGRRLATGAAALLLALPLTPGTYVFSCSVADHRAMGMETTVEVA